MRYKNRIDWPSKNKEVIKVCNSIKEQNQNTNIKIVVNQKNEGTSKTCFKGISHCFDHDYDFVLFTEDDTIFSKDSLIFFNFFIENNFFDNDKLWSIQGESKFFDSKGKEINNGLMPILKDKIQQNNLIDKWSKISWVPSTQFLISRKIWKKYGEIRGDKKGARKFGEACKKTGGYSIYPIIPRVKDIGMTLKDGYSTYYKGENILDKKTTYLTSSDFPTKSSKLNFLEYKESKEWLDDLSSFIIKENNDSAIEASKEKEQHIEPKLTLQMSEPELSLLIKSSESLSNIIEFGIGGSTRTFLTLGKNVYSFETSKKWIDKALNSIDQKLKESFTHFFIDIGKIKFLGYPDDKKFIPLYSNQITNLLSLLAKNTASEETLIFNDGRFRVLTHALAHLLFPKSKVLIHDYNSERPHYDIIFEFSEVIESKETMYLTKRKNEISNEYLQDIIDKYKLDPR